MSRALDAKLAQGLGREVVSINDNRYDYFWRDGPHNCRVPNYSTDGNAMLELDREMLARGWQLELNRWSSSEWVQANYFKQDYKANCVQAKDERLARALAARKALFGCDWEYDYE